MPVHARMRLSELLFLPYIFNIYHTCPTSLTMQLRRLLICLKTDL